MNTSEVWTYSLAYLLPILFFVYMGTDVIVRNSKKVEHRLLSLTAIVYILLFSEEYIRHQLPISYSPELVAFWFSNVGIVMPGLGFHFLSKFAGMEKIMPKYLYPGIFYLPLAVIIVNTLSSQEVISSSRFFQEGVWKYPVYNLQYYIALSVSIFISCFYLLVLYVGKARASTREHKAIFNLLITGVVLCTFWHVAFGYFQFAGTLPPYSYIYGGVLWCSFLRLAMIRFDFLNFVTKRYEKLFNLNPAAILLVELSGKIKEANPSARHLFDHIDLDREPFHKLVNDELQDRIRDEKEIKDYEASIYNGSARLEALIDGDYVSVDNEPHMIMIVRDVTAQKESQEEIRFLAYHDPLTRLPNRRYFYERLNEAIRKADENRLGLAVILIDLDRFKETNDRYGHEAGDEVLRHAARIIAETAETLGMAARLGGDEFVLFIRHAPSNAFVEETIRRIQSRLTEEELQYRGQSLTVHMSVGASFFPQDGTDGDTLLMNADKAMYRVKRAGKAG
ncbi:sensor domain-containing diguanylate cyclase [Cohnella lupini]|uniref:sensor domain-containing diguanylate cyclase n=1 Tax=Cohnella lupini TaxID=1294267 RepID=UPI000E2898B4|nr:sensor domain-containing diguanylate cyclase [Cohnella lupini]